VASAIAVAATFSVTRQSLRARGLWQIGATVLVIAVAVDCWLTGANYVSDIIGLFSYIGLLLLWVSALITLYTGYDYFRAGLRHLTEDM